MYEAFHNILPPSIYIQYIILYIFYYIYKYLSLDPLSKSIISISMCTLKECRRIFFVSRIGVSFWNALDTKIKLSSSLSSFEITLKIALLIHISIISDLLTSFSLCTHTNVLLQYCIMTFYDLCSVVFIS